MDNSFFVKIFYGVFDVDKLTICFNLSFPIYSIKILKSFLCIVLYIKLDFFLKRIPLWSQQYIFLYIPIVFLILSRIFETFQMGLYNDLLYIVLAISL